MATNKELLISIDAKVDSLDTRVSHIENNHLTSIEGKIAEIKNRLWLITGILISAITGGNVLL